MIALLAQSEHPPAADWNHAEPGELSLCDRAAIYTIDNAWWHLVSNYGRDEAVILLERLRRECGGASA